MYVFTRSEVCQVRSSMLNSLPLTDISQIIAFLSRRVAARVGFADMVMVIVAIVLSYYFCDFLALEYPLVTAVGLSN